MVLAVSLIAECFAIIAYQVDKLVGNLLILIKKQQPCSSDRPTYIGLPY
jgi:hypothetical protein